MAKSEALAEPLLEPKEPGKSDISALAFLMLHSFFLHFFALPPITALGSDFSCHWFGAECVFVGLPFGQIVNYLKMIYYMFVCTLPCGCQQQQQQQLCRLTVAQTGGKVPKNEWEWGQTVCLSCSTVCLPAKYFNGCNDKRNNNPASWANLLCFHLNLIFYCSSSQSIQSSNCNRVCLLRFAANCKYAIPSYSTPECACVYVLAECCDMSLAWLQLKCLHCGFRSGGGGKTKNPNPIPVRIRIRFRTRNRIRGRDRNA